jgi:hypothetical protein
MNHKTEANINQLASDVHLITWPIRFIIGFIKTCLFAAAFIVGVPLIFMGLLIHHVVTGQALLDADSVLALKIIFSFCQPFILPIVYRFAQMGPKYRNRAQVKAHFYVNMHWIFLAVLALELIGALVNYQWWDSMATEGSLAVLVIYLSSPLIFLIFTKDQSTVAPVAPDRTAYQSAPSRRSNPLWN